MGRQCLFSCLILKWDLWANLVTSCFWFWTQISRQTTSYLSFHSDVQSLGRQSHFSYLRFYFHAGSLGRQCHISCLISKWDLWADNVITHISYLTLMWDPWVCTVTSHVTNHILMRGILAGNLIAHVLFGYEISRQTLDAIWDVTLLAKI